MKSTPLTWHAGETNCTTKAADDSLYDRKPEAVTREFGRAKRVEHPNLHSGDMPLPVSETSSCTQWRVVRIPPANIPRLSNFCLAKFSSCACSRRQTQ